MHDRCLICGEKTEEGREHHPRCSRRFYGTAEPPKLDMALSDLHAFAAKTVLARITVTGVQKKLSLNLAGKGRDARFTIVGLWGGYILKPPSDDYPALPENEHTIMRLASKSGIPVVPHAMIRLTSSELAYISRRIDRGSKNDKLAMEDFCQISGRLTEDKYHGSLERVGKLLRRHSVYPGLDAVDLFERTVLNYVCGNADMHLKNYSLIETAEGMRFSPAYDLVSTALAIPGDPEESALTINGKKRGLTRNDFEALADNLEIAGRARGNVYEKFKNRYNAMATEVRKGFLPARMQETLCVWMKKKIQGLFQ
jgi:serine/threonine-protein kinase HipA